MAYEKRVCVLKQVKKGFSADGGALTGAGVVLGMANKDRVKTVQDVRAVMNSFIERNGTVTCKELKGVGTGKVVRECVDCVRDAAEFLEAALKNS